MKKFMILGLLSLSSLSVAMKDRVLPVNMQKAFIEAAELGNFGIVEDLVIRVTEQKVHEEALVKSAFSYIYYGKEACLPVWLFLMEKNPDHWQQFMPHCGPVPLAGHEDYYRISIGTDLSVCKVFDYPKNRYHREIEPRILKLRDTWFASEYSMYGAAARGNLERVKKLDNMLGNGYSRIEAMKYAAKSYIKTGNFNCLEVLRYCFSKVVPGLGDDPAYTYTITYHKGDNPCIAIHAFIGGDKLDSSLEFRDDELFKQEQLVKERIQELKAIRPVNFDSTSWFADALKDENTQG